MHLHNHLRFEVLLFEAAVNSDHRYLDDVRRSTLYRCIDGIALGERTHRGVVRQDVRQVAFASEECLGITALTRNLFLLLNIADYSGECREIVVDELASLCARTV